MPQRYFFFLTFPCFSTIDGGKQETPDIFLSAQKTLKVCQNRQIFFFFTKPRLSQARALLCPKVFVTLGI
jgi:hypothetical protein